MPTFVFVILCSREKAPKIVEDSCPTKTVFAPDYMWGGGCINFLIILPYSLLYLHRFSLSHTHMYVCMYACCVSVCVCACVASLTFRASRREMKMLTILEYTLSTDKLCSTPCQQINSAIHLVNK
jgi:hypothetical protein